MAQPSGQRADRKKAGNPPTRDLRELTKNFLEWVQPFREIAIGMFALTVAISGGVAWAVAHFATRSQLFYLECRTNASIQTNLMPLQGNLFAAKIEWRTSLIKQLAQEEAQKLAGVRIAGLSAEINELTRQQAQELDALKTKITEMTKTCASESPEGSSK